MTGIVTFDETIFYNFTIFYSLGFLVEQLYIGPRVKPKKVFCIWLRIHEILNPKSKPLCSEQPEIQKIAEHIEKEVCVVIVINRKHELSNSDICTE